VIGSCEYGDEASCSTVSRWICGTPDRILTSEEGLHLFHSEALIFQDGPLAYLSGFLDHTHKKTHGRTPLDE
jgi:hypothetical protein